MIIFSNFKKRVRGKKEKKKKTQEGESRQREAKSNHRATKEEKQVEDGNCFLNPS